MMMYLLLTFIQQATDFSTSSRGRQSAAPDGPLYYIIVIVSALIVLAVIIFTIKWFIWPGEKSEDHIKRKILQEDNDS